MSDERFTRLIETLLTGQVICEVSAEDLYAYLQDPVQRDHTHHFLTRIGRGLEETTDGRGFYAVYTSLDRADARAAVRKRFNEAVTHLEPLVRWLRLVMNTDPSGAPLSAGDTLRESTLIEAIENVAALEQEVARLSRTGLFANQSTGARNQIISILNKLCDHGYLVREGRVYRATALWSRLYEVLDFIHTHEAGAEDEDAATQQDLLP
jgi:hypothetical protein